MIRPSPAYTRSSRMKPCTMWFRSIYLSISIELTGSLHGKFLTYSRYSHGQFYWLLWDSYARRTHYLLSPTSSFSMSHRQVILQAICNEHEADWALLRNLLRTFRKLSRRTTSIAKEENTSTLAIAMTDILRTRSQIATRTRAPKNFPTQSVGLPAPTYRVLRIQYPGRLNSFPSMRWPPQAIEEEG